MAPGFDTLSDHDFDDEEEIDFSDLRQQYEVRMEEGLDAFVVSQVRTPDKMVPHHYPLGRGWPSHCQRRAKTKARQVPPEKIKPAWQNK